MVKLTNQACVECLGIGYIASVDVLGERLVGWRGGREIRGRIAIGVRTAHASIGIDITESRVGRKGR